MRPAPPRHAAAAAAMAAALLVPVAAPAQDYPQRKAGLWETTVSGMPAGAMTTQQCVDARTDAELMRQALKPDGRATCKPLQMKKSGGAYEMQIDCTGADGRMTGVSRLSGDFQSRYKMETQIRFDPPRGGPPTMNMTFNAQHKGACPPGMAPGEVRTGGFSFNPSRKP